MISDYLMIALVFMAPLDVKRYNIIVMCSFWSERLVCVSTSLFTTTV